MMPARTSSGQAQRRSFFWSRGTTTKRSSAFPRWWRRRFRLRRLALARILAASKMCSPDSEGASPVAGMPSPEARSSSEDVSSEGSASSSEAASSSGVSSGCPSGEPSTGLTGSGGGNSRRRSGTSCAGSPVRQPRVPDQGRLGQLTAEQQIDESLPVHRALASTVGSVEPALRSALADRSSVPRHSENLPWWQAKLFANLPLDVVRRQGAVDGHHEVVAPEELEDGLGLLVVLREPGRDGLGGVVGPDAQWPSADVAGVRLLGARVDQVVVEAALGAQSSREHALDDLFVRHVHVDGRVEGEVLSEELGLGERPRKAVEDEAEVPVVLVERAVAPCRG